MNLYRKITNLYKEHPLPFWLIGTILTASTGVLIFLSDIAKNIINKLGYLILFQTQTNIFLILIVLLCLVVLFFQIRRIFYSGKIKNEEIDFDIRGQGDRIIFYLSKDIPEVNIYFKIVNFSIKSIVLETISFEIWDQQPLVIDSQTKNLEILPKSIKEVFCKKNLTDTEAKRVFDKDRYFSGKISAKAIFKDKYTKYKVDKELRIDIEIIVTGNLRPQDKKIYLDLVEATKKLCRFDQWREWSSSALGAQQGWDNDFIKDIDDFRQKVFGTLWPSSLPELERAIKTLAHIMKDTVEIFLEHAKQEGEYWYGVRFYKIDDWNKELYDKLFKEWENWRVKYDSLIFEATKAANWVADAVRKYLDSDFFATKGKFIIEVGPDENLKFTTYRLEYTSEEKKGMSYKGT